MPSTVSFTMDENTKNKSKTFHFHSCPTKNQNRRANIRSKRSSAKYTVNTLLICWKSCCVSWGWFVYKDFICKSVSTAMNVVLHTIDTAHIIENQGLSMNLASLVLGILLIAVEKIIALLDFLIVRSIVRWYQFLFITSLSSFLHLRACL